MGKLPPKTDMMYFILIDRFIDGDSSNNTGGVPESYSPYDGTNPESLKQYQGGDLRGIIQSLDSLKKLGFTMIWISPFLDNSNTDYVGWWPYHGYHPIDFYAVDEHFGTLEDLKELVDSVHERGLKIIFDMPFNQTAADHPWVKDETKKDWYHQDEMGQPFEITNWQDQEQIEKGELHGLPDLAQENKDVSEYLLNVSKYWIDETGCDGFRLDAVKHIPLSFWQEYNRKIKAYAGSDFLLLGEVFWGEAKRIQPYIEVNFDYLFDIPGYYAIRNTFNRGSSIRDFSEFYQAISGVFGDAARATLIDNHDVARFNVGLGDDAWSKQMLALGWLMASSGLPVIYYGTELGMPGFLPVSAEGKPQDYLNRLPYPPKINKFQNDRKQQVKKLLQLRHQYPALALGQFTEVYKDWSVYGFLKILADEQLLVILNNAGSEEFLSIPNEFASDIHEIQQLYGTGALRREGEELWVRLPANEMSIWRFEGRINPDLPVWTIFTDRLSRDYKVVQLFYVDSESDIEQIQVAGDFNNWIPRDYPSFQRGDTLFLEIPLKPGHYQYKFVVNGVQWLADPNANSFSTDPYGGRNSILQVVANQ